MRKVDNLPPSCAFVTKSGNLNFLEPSGPVRGLLYLYLYPSRSIDRHFIFTGRNSATPALSVGVAWCLYEPTWWRVHERYSRTFRIKGPVTEFWHRDWLLADMAHAWKAALCHHIHLKQVAQEVMSLIFISWPVAQLGIWAFTRNKSDVPDICLRSCKDSVTDSTTAATPHKGIGQRRTVGTTCCGTSL